MFSSTAATYGEPESIPIREDNRLSPINVYGETKLAMERMIHWASIGIWVAICIASLLSMPAALI